MVTWRNWSGAVTCEPSRIVRASTVEHVQAAVTSALHEGTGVRIAGSGHSFTRLVATDEVLIDPRGLNQIEAVEEATARATLGAGARICDLGAPLETRGLSLLNQGDIHAQAISGAVSTGTHGTGLGLGSLSSAVTGLTLVTGEGQVIDCDAHREPEIFHHARVGLGSLGVITRVQMQLREPYLLREEKRTLPLRRCLETIDELSRAHRHVEFFWFPYTEVAAVKILDEVDGPRRPATLRHLLVDQAFENAAWWVACELSRRGFRPTPDIARFCANTFSESSRVARSWEIFPNPRWVRFNEMEYAVPVERGVEAFLAVKDLIEREQLDVLFPIEYRYVRGDDIPLSPFVGRDCAVISCHVYRGKSYEGYFRAVEEIMLAHGGRPHWGKMHALEAPQLRGLYPAWESFLELRARLDPRGCFVSPYTARIFGVPNPRVTAPTRGLRTPLRW